MIRDATAADAARIAEIYAPYVRDTAITFELVPPDAAEIARRIAQVAARFPYIVAAPDGRVAAYAYADLYRTRAAYRWVVETTVYVDEMAQRRGLGRALYEALLDRLETGGYIAAVGVIALPNAASVALHEACGFVHVGTQRGIGYKHRRWHDVGFWQRELKARRVDPDEPRRALGSDRAAAGDELDHNDDHGDHQQQMDQPAGDVHRETEQPQHEQDDGDGPKHGELP